MSSVAIARPAADADARDAVKALPLWLVVAIACVYTLPGLVGHDPWKQDEAYVFGGVLDILKSGDWVVPRVGGVPFMEKPPLIHWLGAITAWLTRGFLPLHDGARLASGVLMAVMLGHAAWGARLLWGEGRGRVAVLLALAPLGFFGNAQLMLTDLPLTAGFAIALAGFAASFRERAWAGLLIGVGVGVGFLGKGLIAPAVLGLAALLLFSFPEWRTRRYVRDLAIAFVAVLPFLVIWPALLWQRSPELFRTWAWDNNVGRYLGFSVGYLGAATEPGYWVQTFPWFLFPLWIFAVAAFRHGGWRQPGVRVGMTVAACMAFVLVTSASARAIYALPMVPALAIACAGATARGLPRLEALLRPMGIAIAMVVAAFVWIGWESLVVWHASPEWWLASRYLPSRFALPFSITAVVLATCATVAFVLLAVRSRDWRNGGLATWVGSLALGWALPAMLWLPWIDYAKSYRSVYESLRPAIPPGVNCVASMQLGESEQALLEYFLGIPDLPVDSDCVAVLRERRADKAMPAMPPDWVLVWHGARPEEYHDRFELWIRPRRPRS